MSNGICCGNMSVSHHIDSNDESLDDPDAKEARGPSIAGLCPLKVPQTSFGCGGKQFVHILRQPPSTVKSRISAGIFATAHLLQEHYKSHETVEGYSRATNKTPVPVSRLP